MTIIVKKISKIYNIWLHFKEVKLNLINILLIDKITYVKNNLLEKSAISRVASYRDLFIRML